MQQAASNSDFVTTSTVARMLERSEGAIRNMARRGELAFIQVGQTRAFYLAQVERLAIERRAGR